MNWLHRLLNPHCVECANELVCQSCETLRTQLDAANHSNRKLLDTILELSRPKVESEEVRAESTETGPIKSTRVPWRIKRHLLEAEDRVKARAEADKQKEIDETNKTFEVKVDPKLASLEHEVLGTENAH